MRRQSLLTNRVILGMLAFFIAVAFWQFRISKQYQPFYKEGVVDYQKGQYTDALDKFTQAYNIKPNALDVILMMGWTNLKLRRFEEAGYYFNRALAIDPKTEEARLGAGFVALETGRGTLDLRVLTDLLQRRRNDPSVKLLVAGALVRLGRDMEASVLFKELRDDKDYGTAAQAALDEMFGLLGSTDPVPSQLATLSKPAQTQVAFRASEGAIWRQAGGAWEKFYITGVNLGPVAPGFYPAGPPNRYDTYANWLRLARQANANTVRAYGLMHPAFYRAFRHQRNEGGKLSLYQEISVDVPSGNDLYDPKFIEDTKAQVRYVVDALHGRGEVPPRLGKNSGVYDGDISAYVSGILFGREFDPVITTQTNLSNPSKKSYDGKYVSAVDATPTQVWVAEMLDFLVGYETDTYNAQHPVAMINWPRTDGLFHPTESGRTNASGLDESKFRVQPAFRAGLFASYHIFLDYPEFFALDSTYANGRDSQGINPMAAYLRELRAHIPYPLVVTEYGVSNSMGILDYLPNNWNHGGHNEDEQAQILSRFTHTIHDAGCAGGVVFELLDEWYNSDRIFFDYASPHERATLWLNVLDPRKRYGLAGYRTSKWRLFTGGAAGWQSAQTLYSGSGAVRSVRAAADEAFLYLRLEAPCPDCGASPGPRPPAETTSYVIALNTAPSIVGLEKLPFGGLRLSEGAGFLIRVGDPASSRLLVADAYNPYETTADGKLVSRTSFSPKMQDSGAFQDLVFPLHPKRAGRGVNLPEQRYDASAMPYGTTDSSSTDFDSLAQWYYDAREKAILVRIPWGKLLVTDPSSLHVFFGFDDAGVLRSVPSSGVAVGVFAVKGPGGGDFSTLSVTESFPAASGGTIGRAERIAWSKWDAVHPDTYLKRSYNEVQKDFADLNRP
jgi:tetratricopeptide (TPR) repeat protein